MLKKFRLCNEEMVLLLMVVVVTAMILTTNAPWPLWFKPVWFDFFLCCWFAMERQRQTLQCHRCIDGRNLLSDVMKAVWTVDVGNRLGVRGFCGECWEEVQEACRNIAPGEAFYMIMYRIHPNAWGEMPHPGSKSAVAEHQNEDDTESEDSSSEASLFSSSEEANAAEFLATWADFSARIRRAMGTDDVAAEGVAAKAAPAAKQCRTKKSESVVTEAASESAVAEDASAEDEATAATAAEAATATEPAEATETSEASLVSLLSLQREAATLRAAAAAAKSKCEDARLLAYKSRLEAVKSREALRRRAEGERVKTRHLECQDCKWVWSRDQVKNGCCPGCESYDVRTHTLPRVVRGHTLRHSTRKFLDDHVEAMARLKDLIKAEHARVEAKCKAYSLLAAATRLATAVGEHIGEKERVGLELMELKHVREEKKRVEAVVTATYIVGSYTSAELGQQREHGGTEEHQKNRFDVLDLVRSVGVLSESQAGQWELFKALLDKAMIELVHENWGKFCKRRLIALLGELREQQLDEVNALSAFVADGIPFINHELRGLFLEDEFAAVRRTS